MDAEHEGHRKLVIWVRTEIFSRSFSAAPSPNCESSDSAACKNGCRICALSIRGRTELCSMDELLKAISGWILKSFQYIGPRILVTLLLAAIILGLRRLVLRFMFRRYREQPLQARWKKNSSYLALLLITLILFPVWMPPIMSLLTVLGIFGAGVLLVLKELILNHAGWLYIVLRRPFEEGNRIALGNYIGDVIDIRLLDFTMLEVTGRDEGGQSTGRILHIPNYMLFTTPLANASKEFSFNWNEIRIPLKPGSDWKQAEKIIYATVEKILKPVDKNDHRLKESEDRHLIQFRKVTPIVFVDFRKGAIVLTLRHLTEPRMTRVITDKIWRELLVRLERNKKIMLCDNPAVW